MSDYIKCPLNYTGGKYKILNSIIPCFPHKIKNFVDLFAGGFNVGINVNADTIYANDQVNYVIEIYKYFKEHKTEDVVSAIKSEIELFNLSKFNDEGYRNLRNKYNDTRDVLDLFVLACYSFNHQIRFNTSHEFNTPFGKNRSTYNASIEKNLIEFCDALHQKEIVFSALDFRDFDFSLLSPGDFVYCDPPYLISTGSYNDGNRGFHDWTRKEDDALFSLLDDLDSRGVLFALSNIFCHKGLENTNLMEWSERYNVLYIDKTYYNCNYHLKDRDAKTVEVLIINYPN